MSSSPAAARSSSDAAQPSEGYFECPRCNRRCKSRTWFLKHLETCYRPAHHVGAGGSATSPTPASAEALAGPSPTAQSHPAKATRGGAGDEARYSPTFEPIDTSSPTSSSTHSYPEAQVRRRASRLAHSMNGGRQTEGTSDAGQELSESGVSPNAASSRLSAFAFGFKHSYATENGSSGAQARSPHLATDEASCRSGGGGAGGGGHPPFHHPHPHPHHNRNPSVGSGVGEGSGYGVPPVLSHRGSASQGSSSYVGSPIGLRAAQGSGESGSAGLTNMRPAALHGGVVAGQPGLGSAEDRTPRRLPTQPASFRLHSDGTWTQYTPSTSSASDSDGEEGDGHGDSRNGSAGAAMNGGESFLAYSGRQSSKSHSCHGGTPSAAHGNASRHDGGRSSLQSSNRLVSPSGPEALSVSWAVHERRGSVASSSRADSAAGGGGAASQARPHSTSVAANSSLPREPERLVPRLAMGTHAEHTPLERKGSLSNLMSSGFEGGGGERLSRSGHGSASPATLSRMSSSASPMFAHAMASPMQGYMSVASPFHGGSGGRVSGLGASVANASNSNNGTANGVRTPRQSERSGAVTPRAISFQRGRAVGSGGFGTVYQAILSDGSLAAVKELKLENTNLKAIDREVRAMSSLPPHPNCVRYLGSRYSAHHYYIIMEYISGGSINSLRKSVGRFRESVFQRYAYMVLLGLLHLHTHGIVHRDIKGANVLLDESGCAKIVDFGCSQDVNQHTTTVSGGGTPLWMAPEVCRGEPATAKSDVWAFGCLCLEMTNTTGLPWNFPATMTLQGVVYALACAKSSPPIPTDLSPEAQDFLLRCLQVDAEERATVEELLQHPFFAVDLMEDSDEDEMLSSCPQSAVKRAQQQQQQVRRGSALDGPATPSDADDVPQERNGRGSPLLPGGSLSIRSPRTSQRNGPDVDGMVVVSESTHSKSPSGPRLDHYPRSVNVGFSLHAVDDDDDDDEDGGQGGSSSISGGGSLGKGGTGSVTPTNNSGSRTGGSAAAAAAFVSAYSHAGDAPAFEFDGESGNYDPNGPPVIPTTSVPANRLRTPPEHRPASTEAEDEDEYTQMITEIITQAREAYTDEERRMTERRRLHNVMYPGSDDDDDDDDDDGSFSDSSGNSAGAAGTRRVKQQGGRSRDAAHNRSVGMVAHSASEVEGTSSCSSSSSGSDDDDGEGDSDSSGGPERHRLGATWRAVHSASSLTSPSGHPRSPLQSPMNTAAARQQQQQQQPAAVVSAREQLAVTPPTHVDPLATPLLSRSSAATAARAGVPSSPHQQQPPPGSPAATAHRPPPRHHTPTSPPPPSSVFRDAMPRETTRDTRPSAGATAAQVRGVGTASSGTGAVAISDPGGPGRPSALAASPTAAGAAAGQSSLRLSPSYPPLSASLPASQHATPAETSRVSATADEHRSPGSPQSAPGLTVGGPRRRSPHGRPSAVEPSSSVQRSPDGAVATAGVEWYTSSSGRLERVTAFTSGASGHQPKELSMAQKELQEMLEWDVRAKPASPSLAATAPAVRRHAKEASSDAAEGRHASRHHHHHHSRSDHRLEESVTSQTTEDSSKGMTAVEYGEKKRKHLSLGIFRSRKSK